MSVICIGDIRADISAHRREGRTIVQTDVGGTGANVALLIAKYGLPVTMLGTVSSGPDGRFLLGQLQDNGVDTSRIRITENGCFNTLLVTEDGREFLSHPWVIPGVRYDQIGDIGFDLADPEPGDIVHTTGAFIENDPAGSRALIEFLCRSKRTARSSPLTSTPGISFSAGRKPGWMCCGAAQTSRIFSPDRKRNSPCSGKKMPGHA